MAGLLHLDATLDRLSANLGVTDAEIALMLGVQPRTIDRWRVDLAFPQHESRQRLSALLALAERLTEAFKTPTGAQAWLRAESSFFGGLAPVDALLRGRIDRVGDALEAIDSGIFV